LRLTGYLCEYNSAEYGNKVNDNIYEVVALNLSRGSINYYH